TTDTDEGTRGSDEKKTGEEELVTKQEDKQNNQTDVNSDERLVEIEEASAGLDPSFLVQKSTKLSKWQIGGIQDYKRVGLSLRETAKTVATSAWYNLSLLEGCTG